MKTNTKTLAQELIDEIFAAETAPPEKKRDMGSSLISKLAQNLRYNLIHILDTSKMKTARLSFPNSRCIACGEFMEVGSLGYYAQQNRDSANGGGGVGPFHGRCLGRE
jgi:hypothetical protein